MSENYHFLSGLSRYKEGKFEAAIIEFTKAIEEEPGNAYIHYERAMSYFKLRQNKKALGDFDKAVDYQPDNPFRYSSRAYIRDSMGDIHGAIADYKMAIRLDPTDAIAHNNLGLLKEKLGYMKESKGHFQQADELAEKAVHLQDIRKKESLNGNGVHTNEGENVPEEQESEGPEEAPGFKAYFRVMAGVFKSGRNFREFIRFIFNGFKHKE